MENIAQLIASELHVRPQQIQATIALLDSGASVPFIARYRKEATDGLDDTQLRTLSSRLCYLRELNERRQIILKNIEAQGKLTSSLSQQLVLADSKTRLEDLYRPYKPKRRTKGQVAIEAGLNKLADQLLDQPIDDLQTQAQPFINKEAGFADIDAVLEGARYILIERFAEDADLLQKLRRHLKQAAKLSCQIIPGKEKQGAKFRDYFSFNELWKKIPPHRSLAMLRGRSEGALTLRLNGSPTQEDSQSGQCEAIVIAHFGLNLTDSKVDQWLNTVLRATWRNKLAGQMETEFIALLREQGEREAIQVFSRNLRDLLMAPPVGAKVTMGLDPGLRTGVKIAIVNATGKQVAHSTIFPHAPQKLWDKSIRTLANLVKTHKVELIAIGNGTGSRETDKLAAETIASLKDTHPKLNKVMVSEAGASVYSASQLAATEFPNLDVSIRGAVSIARRLQDPLAELVKIEPKSIGVGQYQHDVSQSQLNLSLAAVVEDCVNGVGVDVNMASAQLLSQVAGLNKTLAANLVKYRDQQGPFTHRAQLLNVPRLGPKAYQQAAGFLRISNSDNSLDASAVHPEAYELVESIATTCQQSVGDLVGNQELLSKIEAKDHISDAFGLPTVLDILKELEKPGRDPRGEFKIAHFKEGIEKIQDLKANMILEGMVTNVTNFGAFVDIGVHQEGLVHISSLTDKFVSDPHKVVKAGEVVKVRVTEIDVERRRIGLSMRLNEKSEAQGTASARAHPGKKQNAHSNTNTHAHTNKAAKSRTKPTTKQTLGNPVMGNAFADAFAKLKKN